MLSKVTIQDRIDFLLALPPTRLCQMLSSWSDREDTERVWSLLAWLEAWRSLRGIELSGRAKTRLKRGLFPRYSMERLLDGQAWCDPLVLALVSESLLAPLLGAPSGKVDYAAIMRVVQAWNKASNHPAFTLSIFLGHLPLASARAVLGHGRLPVRQRALTAMPDKEIPQLLHVLFFLYRQDFLLEIEMVNLFSPGLSARTELWARVASGLKAYYKVMKEQLLSGSKKEFSDL